MKKDKIICDAIVISIGYTIVTLLGGGVRFPAEGNVLPPLWLQLLLNFLSFFLVYVLVALLYIWVKNQAKNGQIIEKRRLLFGIGLITMMVIFCVGIEHLIAFFMEAPAALYLYKFVSGVFYSQWLILYPCLFLVIGWTVMQGLSLLPKAKILHYDTEYAHKIIGAVIVIYFLIVGSFCAWQLFANWQSYQHSLSGSVEGFRMSFSVPIVTQCIRFFSNHRKFFWAVFIPLGMLFWLVKGPRQSTEL